MFYRLLRAVVRVALRLFYRIRVTGQTTDLEGPVIFVGNHPNGLIDPSLVFILTPRQVTFLGKAPLFKIPVIGQLARGMGALPVYRSQDDPSQMGKNEGTLDACVGTLVAGRAITIFPEGRSHSEPQLAELKTGCARIALRAARRGVAVRIIPIGLTYAQKHRFRSEVLLEVGSPLEVPPSSSDDEDHAAARALTERIADALRSVTLNLEKWEDLPLIHTAEELYALRHGEAAHDPGRVRAFSRGVEILRAEQPERFQALRREAMSFRRRLDLVRAAPADLQVVYRRGPVYWFALRNLAALLFGFPLFLLGMLLYAVPFEIPRLVVRLVKPVHDLKATVKVLCLLVIAPLWAALLTGAAWLWGGPPAALATALLCVPLALFTRYFYERRRSAIYDALTFLVLVRRSSLRARLLVEGEKLAAEVERLTEELRPRVAG
ncbi:MAG: 1-acyl-sn-glycerol-3-phosphate acyltransferase [Myxococcaceae bacterium]